MKNRIALVVGGLLLALALPGLQAAEGPAGVTAGVTTGVATAAAPAGASAKPVLAGKRSMAEKGAFHKVHKQKVKTNCDDCHTKGALAPNTVKLRLNDKLAKGDPGPVDHETCFDCHRRANKPLPYFANKAQ